MPVEEAEEEDDSAAMMQMMGLSGFGSTAGKHVTGNSEVGAVNIKSRSILLLILALDSLGLLQRLESTDST